MVIDLQEDAITFYILISVNCLQEAFDLNMGEFVSRSRERRRFVYLRAEERRMQDLEADEREKLFGFRNQYIVNTLADPAVG